MFLSEGVRQGEENLGKAEPLRGSVLGWEQRQVGLARAGAAAVKEGEPGGGGKAGRQEEKQTEKAVTSLSAHPLSLWRLSDMCQSSVCRQVWPWIPCRIIR